MREEADVIVVGGGPAGLIAAKKVAELGKEVIVVEEDEEIGVPAHCAGLLGLSGIRKLGLKLGRGTVRNFVRGAIILVGNREFVADCRRTKAVVVDRDSFDKELAIEAYEAGAEISLKERAEAITLREDSVEIRTSERLLRGKVAVLAEGMKRKLADSLGFERLREVLPACQADVMHNVENEHFVRVIIDKRISPGFFGWIIPLGEDEVRVGVGSRADPRLALKKIAKRCGISLKKAVRLYFGRINLGGPLGSVQKKRVLLVGDAAGHNKPSTGGGVVFGGICARIAGEEATKICDGKCCSAYSLRCRLALYPHLSSMKLMKKFFALPEKKMISFLEKAEDSGFLSEVARRFDIDFPINALREEGAGLLVHFFKCLLAF